VFFTLMVCLPVVYGVRNYLGDLTPRGALGGPLACSFLGYALTRLVLSVRENHVLFFLLLAIAVVVDYCYVVGSKGEKPKDAFLPERDPRVTGNFGSRGRAIAWAGGSASMDRQP
jgi:hypothetical protein